MKQKFIKNAMHLIIKKRNLTILEEKKLRYGLEAFYNLITKTIVLILLAIIFDFVFELVLLTIIYSTLRLYGFGIHAKTSLQCWFTTLPIYICGCLFIKYSVLPNVLIYIIWAIGFISFLLFAPADTPARPLIHKEKRIRAKIFSIIILLVYLTFIIFYNKQFLSNALLYGILMECIAINPLTYRLFNTPYNNYKTFQKNMV